MMRRAFKTHLDVAACHEAGHALAALWQGLRVFKIEVYLGNPGAGLTFYHLPPRRNPFDPTLGPGSARAAWQDTVSRTLREARVALAGPLAEARLLGKPMRALGAYGDLEHCRRLVERLAVCREWLCEFVELPPMDPQAVINRERARVRRWVARPRTRAQLQQLARVLSIDTTVFGWDLDVILGYESANRGRPALPFPSFDEAPEKIALMKGRQSRMAA